MKRFTFIAACLVLFIMASGFCVLAEVEVPQEDMLGSLYEPYRDILNDLVAEEYDAALEKISTLKEEKQQAERSEAGDIDDYLVVVELTPENFDEYFELITVPVYNGFGETKDDANGSGIISKKYEEGLILYDMDNIQIEYALEPDNTQICPLEQMMYLGFEIPTFLTLSLTGRMTDGTITFVKSEYVESYTIPEAEAPDRPGVSAKIVLKNGEEIIRYIDHDHPY